MESLTPYLIGALVAIVTGLDRTAALQMMISRPLVAAPLTGLLLGAPLVGLTVGTLLELLWLGRLPVGASIPHDDTQVAIGATTLAIVVPSGGGSIGLTLCALLVSLPLGKVGQWIEQHVRQRNLRLAKAAELSLAGGEIPPVARLHLTGLIFFSCGALVTYSAIVLLGGWFVTLLLPILVAGLSAQAHWIKLALILVGVGALLQSLNVRRAYTLFSCGFIMAYFLILVLR